MAYQLPPPPPNDDPKVRAWLFELYKRNQDILDDDSTIELLGEVIGFGTVVNNAIDIETTVVLPYLSTVDGGGPASTFPGTPTDPFFGVFADAYEGYTEDPVTSTDSFTNLDNIYGLGYDGGEILLIAGFDRTANLNGIWQSTPNFATPSLLIENSSMPDLGNVGAYIAWIEYSPPLDRWVCMSRDGVILWADGTDLTTWTEVTYPTGWSNGNSDPVHLIWDTGNALFYTADDGDYLIVSADGKTWVTQSSIEALGGTHPNRMNTMTPEFELSGTKWHMIGQWEEYIYKTGDSGDSTGWTKTANNGVLGGSGSLVSWNNMACDDSILVVMHTNSLNSTSNPANHPDGWGPDGNSNAGFTAAECGFPDATGNMMNLMYLGQYDRPWIIYHNTYGWYDAATLLDKIQPTFARATTEPWLVTLNAEFDAGRAPYINEGTGNMAKIYHANHNNSVWKKNGFAVITKGYTLGGANVDYITFKRPTV